MKILVLYRSFYGNTKRVAEIIAREVVALGHESTLQDVRGGLPQLSEVDVVVIGSPTRIKGANRRTLSALRRLRKNGFGDRLVAVYDTYGPIPSDPQKLEKGKTWFFPGAAGSLEKAARRQGLTLHEETLRCEVMGMAGPLAEDAEAKATAFARSIVEAASIG
jgi:flavodoxin